MPVLRLLHAILMQRDGAVHGGELQLPPAGANPSSHIPFAYRVIHGQRKIACKIPAHRGRMHVGICPVGKRQIDAPMHRREAQRSVP